MQLTDRLPALPGLQGGHVEHEVDPLHPLARLLLLAAVPAVAVAGVAGAEVLLRHREFPTSFFTKKKYMLINSNKIVLGMQSVLLCLYTLFLAVLGGVVGGEEVLRKKEKNIEFGFFLSFFVGNRGFLFLPGCSCTSCAGAGLRRSCGP